MERCLREGLVGGDGFAVDASLIAADANKHRSLPSSEWKTADIGPDAYSRKVLFSADCENYTHLKTHSVARANQTWIEAIRV